MNSPRLPHSRTDTTCGRLLLLALLSSLAVFLLPGNAAAQQGEADGALDVATAYDHAVKAFDAGDFDAGLKVINPVIAEHDRDALEVYGPVFGHFHYIKGMLLIRKKDYPLAIKSLETCYKKYNNDVLKKIKDGEDPKLPNRYRIHALMQWGNSLMAMQQYDEAAKILEKTLIEDPQTEPRIERLTVQINFSKCLINSGKVAKGRDFLITLMDSETLTDSTKRMIFMILANDWSPKATYPQLRDALHKYETLLRNESIRDRYEKRNQTFQYLATRALSNEDPQRALAWYRLMAHPGEVMQLYKQRVAELEALPTDELEEGTKARLAEQIDDLNATIDNQHKQFATMLLGIGAAHYNLGDIAGSRASHKVLADTYEELNERPVILHNLVICDVNLGLWREAYEYGLIFFKEFPEDPLKPSVARVLVEVIFVRGEYQEAYDVSSDVRQDMEVGSDIRDVPDFVTGSSLFHLGRFEESEVETDAYLKNYPEGKRLESAEFYNAATKVNLFKWEEAATKLDSFLGKYPDSAMRPTALHLAGLSHLVLEKFGLAIERTSELQLRFPEVPEIAGSYNAKGDALAGLGKAGYEEIIENYVKAKSLVEEQNLGGREDAAYALRQLITTASAEEKWEDAGAAFDTFQKDYAGSLWRTDAIVGALDALVKLDRRDEGRGLLEELVNELGSSAGDPALDELFGAYADYLTGNYETEEALERMRNFPSDPSPPPAPLRAWLIMAEIEQLAKSDSEGNAEAIDQLFYKLNALREGGNLSNYTLVKLARWTMESRENKAAAAEVYDYIINERPQGIALGIALVDKGRLLSEDTDNSANLAQAQAMFERALNEVDKPEFREQAVLGIARVLSKKGEHEQAQAWWEQYLEDRSWNRARPEANYNYALSLDKRGKKGEAFKVYVSVYVNFAGHLDWSTKAYLRAAEIRRSDGAELDALKILQEMLQRMGHHEHPGVQQGRELFNKWRAEYTPKAG